MSALPAGLPVRVQGPSLGTEEEMKIGSVLNPPLTELERKLQERLQYRGGLNQHLIEVQDRMKTVETEIDGFRHAIALIYDAGNLI